MGVLQSSFYPLALTHTLKAVLHLIAKSKQKFSLVLTLYMKAKDYELFIISQNSLQVPSYMAVYSIVSTKLFSGSK